MSYLIQTILSHCPNPMSNLEAFDKFAQYAWNQLQNMLQNSNISIEQNDIIGWIKVEWYLERGCAWRRMNGYSVFLPLPEGLSVIDANPPVLPVEESDDILTESDSDIESDIESDEERPIKREKTPYMRFCSYIRPFLIAELTKKNGIRPAPKELFNRISVEWHQRRGVEWRRQNGIDETPYLRTETGENKRTPTYYTLFCSEYRSKITHELSQKNGKKPLPTEVMFQIGEEWRGPRGTEWRKKKGLPEICFK